MDIAIPKKREVQNFRLEGTGNREQGTKKKKKTVPHNCRNCSN